MLIQNTGSQEHTTVKAIIYGPAGAGKTTSAGTLDGRSLMLVLDPGLMSLQHKNIDFLDISKGDVIDKESGKPVTITDPAARIERLSQIFKWLHAGCPDPKTGKATWKYHNLFVDSLTEISEVLIQKLQKDFPDRKDSFPMWGEYSKIMKSIVKNFRDLPYNVFMTCLSKPDKDDTGKRFITFDIAGSISDRLPQYFDLVLYLHVDEDGKRFFITRSTPTIICKDRSSKLLPKEEADLEMIIQKIQKKEINQ